uniref:Uncharacterized protein n=1 Tax=viral metagenome TaxID=1070528 RepID=A0A6C0E125_9ZZZZ
MFVIAKEELGVNEIINIIFGQDETIVGKWIINYILTIIDSYKMCPLPKNVKAIDYSYKLNRTHEGHICYEIIKHVKTLQKGYVYNSCLKLDETVLLIKVYNYEGSDMKMDKSVSTLWTEINEEINNRVLKSLDKDSLFQFHQQVMEGLNTKAQWTRKEYVALMSEVLKKFKKESYSSVVKKLQRYGKVKSA